MIKLQPISNIPVVKIKNSIHITIGVFKDVDKNYLKKQGYEMMRDILGEDILIRDLLLVGHISNSCSLVINSNNTDSASICNFVISFRNRYLKNAIVSSFFPVHISFAYNRVSELLKKHENIQNINDDNLKKQAVPIDVQEQLFNDDNQEVPIDVQKQAVCTDQKQEVYNYIKINYAVERIIPNVIERAVQSRIDEQDVDVQTIQTTNLVSSQTARTPLNSKAPVFYPNRVYRCCVVYPVYQYYYYN